MTDGLTASSSQRSQTTIIIISFAQRPRPKAAHCPKKVFVLVGVGRAATLDPKANFKRSFNSTLMILHNENRCGLFLSINVSSQSYLRRSMNRSRAMLRRSSTSSVARFHCLRCQLICRLTSALVLDSSSVLKLWLNKTRGAFGAMGACSCGRFDSFADVRCFESPPKIEGAACRTEQSRRC